MNPAYEEDYDSEKPPATLEEALYRLKQSIVWEFIESDMYKESPCSTFHNWNSAAQKRYIKAAENIKRFFTHGTTKVNNKKVNNDTSHESLNKDVKTLRDYLRG